MQHIARARAALQDHLVIQSVGRRKGHQLRDGLRAGALAEHGHIAGIAAEGFDIVAHPGERCGLVHQAVIARGARVLCQRRMGKVAHRAETVVDCDQYHALPDQRIGLVDRLRAGTILVRAAMQPDHDRLLFRALEIARPYVEQQAVLGLRRQLLRRDKHPCRRPLEEGQAQPVDDLVDETAIPGARLDAFRTEFAGIAGGRAPLHRRSRRAPAPG